MLASTPVTLGPGAFAPIVGLAAAFALLGTQLGVPFGAGIVLGAVGGTASLLVHEFGHVRVARQFAGIESARVSLIWLGAATRLEGKYLTGSEQARVAIAGPRASFALAGALAAISQLPLPLPFDRAVLMLAGLNVALALLNLVPAAPLDGYKLVRGLLWCATGSESRATECLAQLGRVAAFAAPGAVAALLFAEPGLGAAVAFAGGTLALQMRLARVSAR